MPRAGHRGERHRQERHAERNRDRMVAPRSRPRPGAPCTGRAAPHRPPGDRTVNTHAQARLAAGAGLLCGACALNSAFAAPPLVADAPRPVLRAPQPLGDGAVGQLESWMVQPGDGRALRETLEPARSAATLSWSDGEYPPPRGWSTAAVRQSGVSSVDPPTPATLRLRRFEAPMARLWQSKSATLGIGLDRRGKPGLWFTNKIH